MATFWSETLAIALTAAPWLLLGLFAAGLVRALMPNAALKRWLGSRGPAAVFRGAVIGAPLPLCSCGAIPTALALHRGGASRGSSTAFLISTPGIGADSVALTYALLGPFMVAARALGAVTTAVATGLLVGRTSSANAGRSATRLPTAAACEHAECVVEAAADLAPAAEPLSRRLRNGMRFAFGELLDDISVWVLIGLLVAGLLLTLAPPEVLAAYGSGLPAMLLMAVIGIPMYLCAAAATPIGAAMIVAGVSPGTALVFLLAGPITSLATLGVLRREMGTVAAAHYLAGILVITVLLGLVIDGLIGWRGVDVAAQIGAGRELVPAWLEWAALLSLLLIAIRPLRRALRKLG